MLNKIINDFWFDKIDDIKEIDNDNEKLYYYIKCFQNGDFQFKKEFVEYFLASEKFQIFVIGMRLFMSISNHKDFNMLENFFVECDEEKLRVFLAYVQESMSLHVVPYLLGLFEEWEDTGVECDIAECICGLIGKKYYEEETYTIEQLGQYFVEFTSNHDINRYYYNGEECFIGNITKDIIKISMDCYNEKLQFYTDQMPSIISNSTGVKCPVSYGVEINDEIINRLFDYVCVVASLSQEKGQKYFYNNKID